MDPHSHSNKWAVLAVTTFGAFVANADATIVIVALPVILAGLHSTIVTVLWTLTGYILTSTVLLLPLGRLSDLVGRKVLFLWGFVLFALGSALAGATPSGPWLIAFRCLQGVGGAALAGLGTPIITEAFPPAELGLALGINSIAWVLGSLVGPVAGGLLVSVWGWRSVFYVTVPFSLVAAAFGWRVLPRSLPRAPHITIDWAGLGFFSVSLTLLLIIFSEGMAWGWLSVRVLLFSVIVIAATVAFIWRELSIPDPLFDLRLFRSIAFAAAQTVVTFASIGFFATTFLLTFYLQGALGQSPLTTGLLMIPLSAPQLISSPLGGRLADRIGSGWPMFTAMIILGLCALWLSRLPDTLSLWAIAGPLTFMAIANGFYWPPLASMVMKIAPRNKLGAASGLFFTFRNIGFSLSLTLALVFAETSLPGPVAVQVFLGIHTTAAIGMAHALIHAVRSAFRWFMISFGVALLAIVPIILTRAKPAAPSRSSPM
jgi:EmrB/QacA subfamily drug resistance transporter